MKLAIFDDHRAGVVSSDGDRIVDVTDVLRGDDPPEPFGASWWLRACRDFASLRPRLEDLAAQREGLPIQQVQLLAPVLNPTKVMAAASNYASHRREMAEARRESGNARVGESGFDMFLKAPSSIVGPSATVLLPRAPHAEGRAVHYETELAMVVGEGGRDIAEADALDHVLGYTIGMDFTVRGSGDRSRRKSYDTFTPLGPWLTTSDEVDDPESLGVRLWLDGDLRQDGTTADLLVGLRGIIAYASSVMRLEPGDVILTGTPPGVGPVVDGDVLAAEIDGLGRLDLLVSGPTPATGQPDVASSSGTAR